MKKQWFKSVGNKERKQYVRHMFNDISGKYDLMNRIMTSGIDKIWRKKAISRLGLENSKGKVLDLACGTGDMTLEYLKNHPDGQTVSLDFAEKMLLEFRRRNEYAKWDSRINLIQGDAEELPFRENSFDGVTMAFGIRNVPDIPSALRESLRVLRPGSRFVILEITQAPNAIVNVAYQWYFHHLVPMIGKLISRHGTAYTYLPASVDVFHKPDEFVRLMREAGFANVSKKRLSLGMVHLFVGEKI